MSAGENEGRDNLRNHKNATYLEADVFPVHGIDGLNDGNSRLEVTTPAVELAVQCNVLRKL